MSKVRLFTYGKLQPAYYPPSTMTDSERDAVRGDLYENGNDPLIINLSTGDQLIYGHTLTIDASELPELDKAETGFRRTRIVTVGKVLAQIYVWDGPLPRKAHRISRWPKS